MPIEDDFFVHSSFHMPFYLIANVRYWDLIHFSICSIYLWGVLLKISGDVSSSVMALSDQDFKIPPQTFLQMLSENKVLHVTQDVMSTSGPK